MPALPRQMLRHSRVSVAPQPSPINKPSLEEDESELLAARRYCTYNLNWNDYDNKKNALGTNPPENSAPDTTVQSPQVHPIPQTPLKEKILEKSTSPFGGITVTVLQKIEVNADPAIKRLTFNRISRSTAQRRNRISSTRTFQGPRCDALQNILMTQQNLMVNAPTENPENSNDPTDMEDGNSSETVKSITPPKLIHAALVPLEQYRKYKFTQEAPKNMLMIDSNLPYVNPKQKRTLVSSLSDKRTSQIFKQQLLEHSISTSLVDPGSNKSESTKPEQDAPKNLLLSDHNRCLHPRQLSRVNSKRKKTSTYLISPESNDSTNVKPARDVHNNVKNNNLNLHAQKSSRVNSGPSPSVKRPSQIFRQELLEQSIFMSLSGLESNDLTNAQQPPEATKNISSPLCNNRNLKRRQLSRINSRQKRTPVSPPNVKRESQLFRLRLIEQSVSMSLTSSGLKDLTSIKPAQNGPKNVIVSTPSNDSYLRPRQLSRVNSKRKRSSISTPRAQRTSQVFRQRLLEQSVSMSLTGSGSKELPQSKLSTRRLSGKARYREVKREGENGMNDVNTVKPKAFNLFMMPKILESEELSQKVKQEIQRQEKLNQPRPPPRQATQKSPLQSSVPKTPRPKENSSSLISSLPERKIPRSLTPRSVIPTSPGPISIDLPPFPTHLSHRSIIFPMSLPMF